MSPVLKTALAGLAIVVALVGVGCGDGGDPPPPGTASAAEYLVKPADVSQQPAGSPQQSLLRWWMSIQYNDFDGYLASLAAPLRQRREADGAAATDLALASGELVRAQPKITSTTVKDGTATLYTRIESRQPVGATRFTTSSTPQAFTLVREGGEWKVADDFFVENRANNIRKAVQEASDSAAAGN